MQTGGSPTRCTPSILAACIYDHGVRLGGLQTDIAVATPLRLSKVAKQTDLSSVRYLILDEADKLFEEGLFKQTDRVIKACSHPRLVRYYRDYIASGKE